MSVKPIPEGYHTVTPYLMVKNSEEFVEFITGAFNAEEIHRSSTPDGKIMHAEIKIGDSMIMLSEATEENPAANGSFYLYVKDIDSVYRQALAAGAVSLMEPADQFYGDRNAGVKDPFGITWWIGTHIEDVPPEEMQRREQEAMKKK